MKIERLMMALLLTICCLIINIEPIAAQRLRPPDAIKCSRNELTSFTGRVTFYRRTNSCVTIKMATDDGTKEQFTISVPNGDATKIFLMGGEPFTKDNWSEIEKTPHNLKAKQRATIWVCQDGTKIIDWQQAVR